MQGTFDLVRIAVLTAVMIPACISDWKKREVSDIHWIILGIFGITCMLYEAFADGMRIECAMQIAGTAMILVSVLFDIEKNVPVTAAFYSLLASMFIIPLALAPGDDCVMRFSTVPVMFVIFLGMFSAGLIKGGADAKCLITTAMVFQTYPEMIGMPAIAVPLLFNVFPFALAVLMHACLFTTIFALCYLAVNVKRNDIRFPQMLMGYRMDAGKASASHVWPMEVFADGEIRITAKAQDPNGIPALTEHGAERIWVTPMIPFMIPLAAAMLFISFIGNIFFIPF